MRESRIDLAAVAAGLADHLHAAGLPVGPDSAGRFASSLMLVAPTTTDELYWIGRTTLTGSPADIEIYDRVFADVFLGVADVADHRGDPNQPNLQSIGPSPRRRDTPRVDADRPGEARSAPPSGLHEPGDDGEREMPVGAPASATELLRRRDFAHCTIDELSELRRLVAALRVAPPLRTSRRRHPSRSGDSLDRRATLRLARRTGGHPARLARRRAGVQRRKVVLIADVSGSMESYARAYLYLLHGAARALEAETFVFATRLTRITKQLRTTDPERAMRAAVSDVDDWSGGTRIGAAIADFNDGWGRRGVARGAVVVIVSDGWESDDPALLGEQMARLGRLAHRIVWVNPRARSDRYRPLVGGMQAALPHVDTFTSGHSLAALDEVLAAIARP